MQKRNIKLIKNIAVSEIILLISMSFAIAFILQENLVSATLPGPSGSAAAATTYSATSIAEGTSLSATVIKAGAVSLPGDAGTLTAIAGKEVIIAESAGKLAVSQGGVEYGVFEAGTVKAGAGGVVAEAASLSSAENYINLGLTKIPLGAGGGWFFFGHLAEGLVWGGVLALGIKFLGPMLGLEEDAADAAE